MRVDLAETLDTLVTLVLIVCCVLALVLVGMLIIGLLTGKIGLVLH